MLEKISILLIGMSLIVGGIYLLFYRTFYSWKYGLVNMGSYHSVIGIIFLIVGLFFVYKIVKSIIRHKP
jgi:uncharacterized protein YneF (UPF0154 family)